MKEGRQKGKQREEGERESIYSCFQKPEPILASPVWAGSVLSCQDKLGGSSGLFNLLFPQLSELSSQGQVLPGEAKKFIQPLP